ncbi:MAG: cobalt-zinc-cadmium efflux system outer membrane protein [Myxococcota bacterium]
MRGSIHGIVGRGVAMLLLATVSGPLALAAEPTATEAPALDGTVDRYVARALDGTPAVRAAFQRWEAAVHRVARARALPEPIVQLGVFVQSVETRVGPQQARISVQQAFPWPTALTAGGAAAGEEAHAAEAMLEATAVAVAERVELAYWSLWEVRATRALHGQHLEILTGLSQTTRSRLEIGGATLSDLQQIDLSRARLEDGIRSMDEAERSAEANLRAAIGERDGASLPTTTEPRLAQPAEADLTDAVLRHPTLASLGHVADAADARAKSKAANRLPGFTVGADWIITGPALMPNTPDDGKDAVAAGLGLRVPLWQGTYSHDVAAERGMAAAHRAEQQGRGDHALAALAGALSDVRDSARRVAVHSGTLLPQADAAYASVLGNYTVGQSAVAQTLLAQRDLLDLSVELARASADHQRAWARLDQLAGREVARAPIQPEETP